MNKDVDRVQAIEELASERVELPLPESSGDLKIGKTPLSQFDSNEEVLLALQALPSPLPEPPNFSLWSINYSDRATSLLEDQTDTIHEEVLETDTKEDTLEVLLEYEQNEEWRKLYLGCGELYEASMSGRVPSDPTTRAKIRALSVLAYERLQGRPNDSAISVEQREFAISSGAPIGTHNLQDCLGLFLWDSRKKVMAHAHLDLSTRLESLNQMFTEFSPGPLEMTLVGSRFSDDPSSFRSISSYRNILETLSFLAKRNITVSQAEIGTKVPLLATSVTGDPKTGTFTRCFPKLPDPLACIGGAATWGGEFGAHGEERSHSLTKTLPLSEKFQTLRQRLEAGELPFDKLGTERELYIRFTDGYKSKEEQALARRLPTIIELYLKAKEQLESHFPDIAL